MRIILLGAPGSGKGTQGDLIAKRFGFPRISTGDLLRLAVQKETALGKAAEARMNQGLLVSDDIVEGLVQERISSPDCHRGYILDGFPRNIAQAKALETMDPERPEIVVGIEVSATVLVSRLSQRWICPACGAVYNVLLQAPREQGICDACHTGLIQRTDDQPEVVLERIKVYQDQTEKLVRYYREKNVYKPVNGEGSVESIFQMIAGVLETELARLEENRIRP